MDVDHEWRTAGIVLEQYNRLEHEMGRVIADHLSPADERRPFLERVMLHPSVIPFGAKAKLIGVIARDTAGPVVERQRLHQIMSLRNALVHFPMLEGVRTNQNALRPEPIGLHLVVELPGQDLKLEERPRPEVIRGLLALIETARAEVKRLHQHLKPPN